MKNYKNRVFDSILRDALDAKGAVLIEGAKWCGKTTAAEQIAKSVIYLNNPKLRDQYFMTAQTNPQRLLEGDNPRLIDDWQTAPELWDTIRFDVDHSDADGKYILTGSAVPLDDGEDQRREARAWHIRRGIDCRDWRRSAGRLSRRHRHGRRANRGRSRTFYCRAVAREVVRPAPPRGMAHRDGAPNFLLF